MKKLNCCNSLLLVSCAVLPCKAASVFLDVSPGTGAPPMSLGGYAMQQFPAEGRATGTSTTTVAAPAGGILGLDPVSVAYIGSGWATWSHGYAGAVYTTTASSLTLALPAGTQAFYLYIEPNNFSAYEFTATSGEASANLSVNGSSGASYVGVYTDDPLFDITTLTILNPGGGAGGFAVGEFGVDTTSVSGIPEPGSLVGLGCVLSSGLLLRSRRQRPIRG